MLKQHRSATKKLVISIFSLLFFGKAGFSQISISGPTCVQTGVEYTYNITGNFNYGDYFSWYITGGVSSYGNTSENGTNLFYLNIKFTSSSGYISVNSSSGNANLSVAAVNTLSAGSITSNSTQTINYNFVPSGINCSAASGGNCTPAYFYQWQSSTDGTNWPAMPGKTSQNLSFVSPDDALQQTTYFRRKVTESNSGSEGYSGIATVYVIPPLNPYSVSPSIQNIFAGDNASSIGGSPAYGGSCENFDYQWEYSTNGTTFFGIALAVDLYYSPGAVDVTTYYRRKVTCGSETAYTPAVVVNVYQHLSGGSISAPVSSTLYNTSPGQINGTAATGGICSSHTYQWQSSTNGSNWSPIGSSNVQNYTPGNLTAHTYFRRMVTCGSETLYSNTVFISVYNPLTVGTLSGGNSPIYSNEAPGTLSISPASEGDCSEGYTYQWYQSTDGTNFSLISGVGGLVYTIPPLGTTTQYRVTVICGSESFNSNVRTITVYPTLDPGLITTTSFEIPFNTVPSTINATSASGGNCGGTYTYKWQKSSNNSTWNYITGSDQNLSFSAQQTQGYYYRRETECAGIKKYTNSIFIEVACSNGAVSCSQIITPGGTASAFTLTNSGGGAPGVFAEYQWESSTDEINWTSISGATNTTYTPISPSLTTYYRVKTSCGAKNSYANTVRIKVKGPVANNMPNGSTASANQTAIGMASYPVGTDANNQNYIRSRTFAKRGITELDIANAQTEIGDVAQQTEFIDGLGRPIQSVAKGATPAGSDLIATTWYDQYGRVAQKYLPYTDNTATGNFRTDPATQQPAFYNGYFNNAEGFYYSNSIIEASPLNRVLKETAPGKSWTGSNKGARAEQRTNRKEEDIKIWAVGSSTGAVPSVTAVYNTGELFVTETTDESENKVIEYKDKEGKTLLKKVLSDDTYCEAYNGWLSTYYIYDDYGRLRWVLQPKAVEWLLSNNWNLSSNPTVQDQLCFRYEYDTRGRMIMKKVPGAGIVDMVYDTRDRLLFTQDANMRGISQWLATLYDQLNRPVLTGFIIYAGDRSALQSYVDGAALSGSSQTVNGSGPEALAANATFNLRDPGRPLYQASNSIEFGPGFESEEGAEFVAEIVSESGGASFTDNISVYNVPLPPGNDFNALTITYYDGYGYTGAKSYEASLNSNLCTDCGLYAETNTKSDFVKGAVTGTRIKVLGTNTYHVNSIYYDSKSRVIQTKSDNISEGEDIALNQYDFAGKVLSTYTRHQNPSGTTINVLTKINYDHAGRVLSIGKSVNGAPVKTITQNSYDELGQLKKKEIGKKADNSFLETQDYLYNIRGWLSSMNKDYATNTGLNANTRKFGMELSYDFGFTQNQLSGNIGGIKWRSKGDGEQRAYGFDYDNMSRLIKADFNQNNSGWNVSAGLDFSVSNLTYDVNGNILSQDQKGWKVTGSNFIDRLRYSYVLNTNRLQNVIDLNNDVATKVGDFRTGMLHPQKTNKDNYVTNPPSVDPLTITDYVYDENGNLVKDLNKDIVTHTGSNGIVYNHLNLPSVITVKASGSANKGTITYTYDAAGNKLKKTTVEEAASVNHNGINYTGITITTTTTYIGGIVYESKAYSNGTLNTALGYSDRLQFVSHEEGRARLRTSDNTFQWDYFIKDHLGNVRMVLTDEEKQDAYPAATMETTTAAVEEAIYSNIAETRTDKPNGYPYDPYLDPHSKVAKVNGSGNKIGPGIVLKVMAGDKFNLYVSSYWKSNSVTPDPNTANPLTDLLGVLSGSIAPLSGGKASSGELSGSSSFSNQAQSFLTGRTYVSDKPKAYVQWVLFDEQFKYVSSTSGFEQVGNDGSLTPHTRSNLPVEKNGYLYVYVSNETTNLDVFFDNLTVTHVRGPLVEETHYYPFGLTMAGISSKALNNAPTNKYKFNSIEQNNDFDINMYDAFYRNLDPQIGRFWQIDPKLESAEAWSPYAAMLNNPIRYSDPLGDSAAWFKPDGSFWKFVNDGKKEWSGVFYQTSTITSSYEKDGVQYEVHTYSDGVNFEFNDPDVDVLALKNGIETKGNKGITGIEMLSDDKVNNQIDRSGVKDDKNHSLSYAREQGANKMDYGVQGIRHGDLDPKKFYLRGGTAYNVGDIGNYLWGRGMGYLRVPLGVAILGAHFNNILHGRDQKTAYYDFGPGTYGKPGFWDSPGDQRAIINGYSASPPVIEAYKKTQQQISNYMKNWKPYQN